MARHASASVRNNFFIMERVLRFFLNPFRQADGAVDAGLAVFAEGDGLVAAVHAGRACVTPCLSPCEHYSKTFVRKDYRWAAAGSFLAIAPTGFPYGSQNTRRPDGRCAGY